MDFFEQIGKKISTAGQSVAQQTRNFADVSQLNSAISDKEKKIAQLFCNIGQRYYETHKTKPSAEYGEAINEISNLYMEIAQNEEKIKQIKGITKCPRCGADVMLNASFCNACGARIERETATNIQEEGAVYCPACHAAVDPDASFCNHCGTKIK